MTAPHTPPAGGATGMPADGAHALEPDAFAVPHGAKR